MRGLALRGENATIVPCGENVAIVRRGGPAAIVGCGHPAVGSQILMVQTNFTVGSAGSLTSVLSEISTGGADAAADTAYTITTTAGIDTTASVTLDVGSSVTLEGTYPFIAPAFSVVGTIETDLNFTGTITLDNGVLINPSISLNNGTVVAGLFSGTVLGTTGDSGDTAVNSGTINSSGSYAAVQFATGIVQNGWNGPTAALITGVPVGVDLQTSGLVQNGGTIIATGGTSSIGVYLGAGTVDNGQITDTFALISGTGTGVDIAGAGTVVNDGTIIGVAYEAVYLGSGSVTNGELGSSAGLIEGSGSTGNGVWIGAGGLGTVTNFATIIGSGFFGVYVQKGGSVTNGAPADTGAQIIGASTGVVLNAAGSVTNYATIQGNIGVFLETGGTVGNLTAAALINGYSWGVVVEGVAGYVTNLGIVQATGTGGLGVDFAAGGTIINGTSAGSAATILGGSDPTADGVRIAAGAAGAGALVLNDGAIEGTVGVDFQNPVSEATGTLTNDGLVEGTGGVAVVFGTGAERLVLQPDGSFIGTVIGGTNAGDSTTMELAAGTDGALSSLAGNSGTVTDGAGSFTFSYIQTIAVDASGSWTIAGPGTLDDLTNDGSIGFSGGTVTLSQFVNDGLVQVQNSATATIAAPQISGTGDIQLSTGGDLVLDVASIPTTQTIVFADGATLEVGGLSGFDAPIQGFAVGDTIIVDTTVPATFSQNGSLISVVDNTTTLGVLTFDNVADATTAITTPDALIDRVICFLPGTMIATPSGQRAVEKMSVGDLVVTANGTVRPITWIGTGRVLATRGRRNAATPVIVSKGALGPNLPYADLRVTKGHAFWFDGVLIPVEFLVNHRSIRWDDKAQEVTVYHIELETHDVLLANGAPAESYRDDGNRWLFRNANAGWEQSPKLPCAPVLTGGSVVDEVWRRLLDRAGPRPGVPLTDDPDLHLRVDGGRVGATARTATMALFHLARRPGSVRLVSRAAAPQELGLARDPRCLGVAVRRIELRQGSTCRMILAGDAQLTAGFHPFEAATLMHWTDGDAALPAALFERLSGPLELVVHLRATARYIDDGVRSFATGAAA
jgi:hypothetical protein